MVRRRIREKRPSKTLADFKVVFEPVFLPEDQNKARLEKLADLFLECFANARRSCKRVKDKVGDVSGLLEVNHDEIFGLA